MLTKLIKYEFKSTARTFGLIYLVMVLLCSVTGATSNFELEFFEGNTFWGILLAVTIMFLFAAIIFTTALNLNRFEKGVFKDEGYLLHTLPVRSWEIIASRLIPAVVWTVCTVIVMIVSIVFMVLFLTGDFVEFFGELIEAFRELTADYLLEMAKGLLLSLVSLVAFIVEVYAARSLGHLFQTHQTIWSVGIWFLLNMAQSNLFNLTLSFADTYTNAVETSLSSSLNYAYTFGTIMGAYFETVYPLQILFYLITSVIFWIITQFVLSKKLNLD